MMEQVRAGPNPGVRTHVAMCRGPRVNFIHEVLCFGGIDWNLGVTSNALWAFNTQSRTWSMAHPGGLGAPPARVGAKMYFDSARNVTVLHGGHDGMGPANFADTWEWDGSSWTQRSSADTIFHLRAGIAYDDARGCGVQFGGEHPATGSTNAETHHYCAKGEPYGTGCPGASGVPTLSVASLPTIGGSYVLDVANVPANTLGLHFLDAQNATSSFGPLPLNLGAFGFGATCNLLVGDLFTLAVPSVGAAAATWNSIPPFAFGAPLFSQFAILDTSAQGSLTMTNAVSAIVGY